MSTRSFLLPLALSALLGACAGLPERAVDAAPELPAQFTDVAPLPDGVLETVRTQIGRTNAAKLFMGIKAVRK